MTTTKYQVEQILKTLPIGYYIGRNLEVTLDETGNASYYIPMDDKIVISYPMISDVITSMDEDHNLENDIRTLLYHEVSHAMLTPKRLKMNDVLNIVEDERIESILRSYYLGVNFREFVKRVNKFHGEKPSTPHEAFYYLVRYRIGTNKWLNRLEILLDDYKKLTRFSGDPVMYKNDVEQFYKEFIKEWKPEKKETPKSKSTDGSSDEEEMNNEISSSGAVSSGESDETDESKKKDEGIPGEPTDEEIEDGIVSDDEIKKLFSKDSLANSNMSEQLNQVLQRLNNYSKRNGSAINAYSGVLDPRSASRPDYKFFVQANRMGHAKANSKIHLNLFIDRSGSFWKSEKVVNQLLFALAQYEKKDQNFSFDLITIGMTMEVHSKSNRVLKTGGGNRLLKEYIDIVKKMQLPEHTNYNLVLFDGDAVSDNWDDRTEAKKYFSAFNQKNTTIISDESNQAAIERNCSTIKKIFTTDYAKTLIEKVFQTLNEFAR